MKIIFSNKVNKNKNIYIKLTEIKEDNDTIIHRLLQTIKDMKEENSNIKKEIKELKEQTIQSLINENKFMKEKLNELLKEINKLKEKNNNTSNLDKESSIVKSKEDIDLIHSWINRFCFYKNIKYKKLYRATEDGDKTSDFHRLCDGQGPTLTIGRTKKGNIFGGFTMAVWSSNGDYTSDPSAFVFSLNQKKYFRTQVEKNSIACQANYGPKFGSNHAIEIANNCLSSSQNYSAANTSYGNNLGLTEKERFSLNELEVFLVEPN